MNSVGVHRARGATPWNRGVAMRLGAVAAAAAVGGCASPIVVGPDYAGVGVLRQDTREWAGGARYDEVRGFGVLVMDGALRIGAVRVQRLVCPLGEGASYRVRVPIGEVAVGAEAGEAAAELAAAWVGAGTAPGIDPAEESP